MGKKVKLVKSKFSHLSEDEVINNLIEQRKLQQEALIKIISHIDGTSIHGEESKILPLEKVFKTRKRPPD